MPPFFLLFAHGASENLIPASVQKPPLLEDRACFKKSLPRKGLQSRTMLRGLWTSLDGGAAHAGEGLNFPGRSTLAPDTTLAPPPASIARVCKHLRGRDFLKQALSRCSCGLACFVSVMCCSG